MTSRRPESDPNAIFLLPTDIPCGDNNAFAPSLAAWHRMVLSRANYICEQCSKEIPLKWRGRGQRKLPSNSGHHIISQNLADGCGKPELKRLLACGIAYCESCHWNEHRRLGGYEYTGALRAFSKLKGLELLDKVGVGNTVHIGLSLSTNKELSSLYDTFLHIALDYEPGLKESVDSSEYENKALQILSGIFYLDVYEELKQLGWDRMCKWTRGELRSVVDKANNRWWDEDVECLAKEYNRLLKK